MTANAGNSGTWQLGDRLVNRLGYGAMRITGSGAFDAGTSSDRGVAIRVLRRAVELGVNHIDTAAFYFSPLRSANELINTALRPYLDGLVIATKVGPSRSPSGQWLDLTEPSELRGQVEQNLRELGRDALDVVNLRLPGNPSLLAEQLGVLADAQRSGLIRHIGVSNARLEHVRAAQAVCRIVCVQNSYGLGYRRRQDEIIDHCRDNGIAFVPFFAIAGQRREAGYQAEAEREIIAIAAEHEISPAQLRIAWTLHRGPHMLAIPGTGNREHLEQNVAAGSVKLSRAQLDRLAALHRRASL